MQQLILAAGGGEEHSPLMPAWPEVIAALIFLGILVFIMQKYVVPRFERAFKERTEAIEGGMKRAEEAQAEAKAALEEYQAKLAEARHEASRITEHAREQGASIIAEMREQAQAESQRIVAQAQATIEAERQQAVTSLRTELGDLATQLAGRIVGETLDDDARQRRVVDRFLEELEQADSSQAAGDRSRA
jgi:F-type H+-transporting ATPase subunit b